MVSKPLPIVSSVVVFLLSVLITWLLLPLAVESPQVHSVQFWGAWSHGLTCSEPINNLP